MRYARALLKAATDAKAEEKVYLEMQTLAKSYIDVPSLRRTIDNPMLAKDKKKTLLVVACGGASGLSSKTEGTSSQTKGLSSQEEGDSSQAKEPSSQTNGASFSQTKRLSPQTERFIDLVLRGDREDLLQFMANSYVTLYRQQKNIIRGKLTTAVAVSEAVERKMRQMVESKTNGTVQFEAEVDPEIIGGFVLEYDTYRLDASVQSRLRSIQAQLKR